MEVHFNSAVNTPDPPPASPTNSPDQEDTIQEETGYAVVLDLVNNLRDKLSALNLDNTNIRAACEALRRQCHSQGVAFGDLSQLVKQSLEGRQYQQPREETGRPYPLIRPELIDGRGNLRAEDIGITWQGGDTFLHGVRIAGPREDMEDTRHRPAMSTPYPPGREDMEETRHHRRCRHHTRRVVRTWKTHVTDRRCRHHTRRGVNTRHATYRHHDSHVRCVLRCLTHQHTAPAKKDVQVTDRRHPYSGSTTKPSGGQLGSVISKRWPMYTDGIRINEHCRWSRT